MLENRENAIRTLYKQKEEFIGEKITFTDENGNEEILYEWCYSSMTLEELEEWVNIEFIYDYDLTYKILNNE